MRALIVACVVSSAVDALADEDSPPAAAMGKGYFLAYCASCHGADARGDGPVAPALAQRPPDLTRIAARGAGEFATDRIAAYITGRRSVSAHGSREMPVWGRQFVEDEGAGEASVLIVRGQLRMLMAYLASIQR